MYLYKITNNDSKSIYIGITKTSINNRFSSHKNAAKRNVKSALYDAIRKYGKDSFSIECMQTYSDYDVLLKQEEYVIRYMKAAKIPNYNIKDGGSKVFGIRDKESWKEKLKEGRIGRKPALGMKHSDSNKKAFSEFGKLRWDIYGRYPKEVLDFGFTKANKMYGISKTHYYRLRKERMLSNE
jgi:group I intron endonuclease